jgi:hypothetical protein
MAVSLPWSGYVSLVIRTDFDHDEEWEQTREAITEPSPDGFTANVRSIDDSAFAGCTPTQLLELLPDDANGSVAFLVDTHTLTDPQRPILVINLFDYDEDTPGERKGPRFGDTFRVIPSEMWGVENNLSLSNMGWREFADRADADGVFRGFAS